MNQNSAFKNQSSISNKFSNLSTQNQNHGSFDAPQCALNNIEFTNANHLSLLNTTQESNMNIGQSTNFSPYMNSTSPLQNENIGLSNNMNMGNSSYINATNSQVDYQNQQFSSSFQQRHGHGVIVPGQQRQCEWKGGQFGTASTSLLTNQGHLQNRQQKPRVIDISKSPYKPGKNETYVVNGTQSTNNAYETKENTQNKSINNITASNLPAYSPYDLPLVPNPINDAATLNPNASRQRPSNRKYSDYIMLPPVFASPVEAPPLQNKEHYLNTNQNQYIEYTRGELYHWTNPNGLKIPKIKFDSHCIKCHGSGTVKPKFDNVLIPCPECYKKHGFCETCYGTKINYLQDEACTSCQGGIGNLCGIFSHVNSNK